LSTSVVDKSEGKAIQIDTIDRMDVLRGGHCWCVIFNFCARGGLDYSTKYTFRQDADFHSHNAECAAIVASTDSWSALTTLSP
jgi:hypothetical protein